MEALQSTYGDSLTAAFRGMFALDNSTNEYLFLNGKAALSSTVTASWDESLGYLRVGKDGTVRTLGLSLACPAYDFYKPDGEGGLGFDFSEGFKISIDPAKNKSFFNIEIPGATSKVTGAELKIDGRLTFCGEMSISNPLVDIGNITLSRIGMNFDSNSRHHIEGIEASGSVDLEEIMGAMASNVSANINTFDGEEEYGFALDLNIPNVFEAEAELTLVRLDNGSLAPDELMFALSVAAAEIPIAPPALSITGVGGGFRDLAATLNDDPYSLPPLKVSVSMNAKILEAVEGRGTLTAGLGYCSLALSNATLMDIVPLGVESKWELFTADDFRNFHGIRYKGIASHYILDVSVDLPTESMSLLSLSEAVDLDMFVGASGAALFFELDGDGSVTGKVKLPKKLGMVPLPGKIAGYEIASAEIALALSGKAAIDLGNNSIIDTLTDCADTFVGSSTLTYKSKLFDLFNTYIVASTGEKNVRLSVDFLGQNLGHTFGWGSQSQATVLVDGETKGGQSYSICAFTNSLLLGSTENGKSVLGDGDLLAANGVTMEQIASDESGYTVELSDTAKNGQLMFILTPKNLQTAPTESELESMFSVTKADGTAVPLVFSDYDTQNGEVTNAGNAYTATGGYDGILDENVNPAVVIMLPDNNETYTITAKTASSAPIAFDIECIGAELPESIASGCISELKDGGEYALRAYLMDGEGEYYSVGEDVALTNADNGKTVASLLPVSSVAAYESVSTGSYTLVYRLLRKVRGVDENDEPAVDEFGNPIYYYVELTEYTGATVTNTNPYQLQAPTAVTLTATGSEVLRAQWDMPAVMESAEIIGYSVSVEQLIDGVWTDTGARYNVDEDVLGNIPTSVSMAIASNGVDDGLLKAGNTYRVKVCAICGFEVVEDGETTIVEKTSTGAYSAGVFLAPATPPTLAYDPSPVTDDKNVKTLYVKPGNQIRVNATAFDGKTIASVAVTNLNDNSPITVGGNGSFIVPEFDGSLTIKILVCDSAGDKTADYITLLRDDTAPIITLNNIGVIANTDGSYAVSGITEPGATVTAMFKNIPVAADGTFTFNGQLDLAYEQGTVIVITATDAAGNTGSAMFTVGTKLATPVITPTSGTYYEPLEVEISCTAENVEVRYTLDGSEPTEESALYSAPFEIGSSLTLKAKAFQAGMEPSDTASATYTFAEYKVTFVDWNGDVLKTEQVKHGAAATAPEAPTRLGYTFSGWDKDFSNVTADMTVTATYVINKYTVTFKDGYSDETISTALAEHGSSVEFPTPPKHDGYTFTGWDHDGKNITEDTTITARYEKDLLQGDVNVDGEVNTGDAVLILQAAVEVVQLSEVQRAAADCNHDGEINTGDAVAVLKFCVGLKYR